MTLSTLIYSYSAVPYLTTLIFEWTRPKCKYSGKPHTTSRTFPIQNFDKTLIKLPHLEWIMLINYELDWEYMYFNTSDWRSMSSSEAPILDLRHSLLSVPRVRSKYFSGIRKKLRQFEDDGRIILGRVQEY